MSEQPSIAGTKGNGHSGTASETAIVPAPRRLPAPSRRKPEPKAQDPNRILALTSPQSKAVFALVAGKDISEAAAAAGVERDKVESWMFTPTFICAMERVRRQAWDSQLDRLRRLGNAAIAALESVMSDVHADPRAKVAAAALALRAVGLNGETSIEPAAPRDVFRIQNDETRKRNSDGLASILADLDAEQELHDRGLRHDLIFKRPVRESIVAAIPKPTPK